MPRIGIGYDYRETQNERDNLRSNSEENFIDIIYGFDSGSIKARGGAVLGY